jgi:O-acetyl-ADP-ribose deacetylase (regulator of RNase III)
MNPILYVKGDATHPLGVEPSIIVHCCNNIGVWGAGFVLAISKRWPEPEREYRKWAREYRDGAYMPLGAVQFVEVPERITVANLIGQSATVSRSGVPPVRYEAIEAGLRRVAIHAGKIGASVHMPRMGCGLAGGEWSRVSAIVEKTLCRSGVQVTVYDFN